jgi:hypothetical protein
MSGKARPVRTPTVLRAIRAPELERFLSRASVDLLVTDQVESLKVRVAKGIEVLERKTLEGIRRGRERAVMLAVTLVLGVGVAGAHLALLLLGKLPRAKAATPILTLIAALALFIGLVAGKKLVVLLGDVRRLSRTAGHHGAALAAARTQDEVLQLADAVLAEARELGAVEAEGGAGDPDRDRAR